jgi:hypothetical protein
MALTTGRGARRSIEPVFDTEAGDVGELPDIRSDESKVECQGVGGNEEVNGTEQVGRCG